MIRAHPLAPLLLALSCYSGGPSRTLVDARGHPTSSIATPPPECRDGCFLFTAGNQASTPVAIVPRVRENADYWFNAGTTQRIRQTDIPAGSTRVEVGWAGDVVSHASLGEVAMTGAFRTTLGTILSMHSVDAGEGREGAPPVAGSDSAIVTLETSGKVLAGRVRSRVARGLVVAHAANASGRVAWAANRGMQLFIDAESEPRVTFGDGSAAQRAFVAVFEADRSLAYVLRLPDVTETPGQLALDDSGNAFFSGVGGTVWDGATVTDEATDPADAFLAKASTNGALGFAIAVRTPGRLVVAPTKVVPDGSGGAWWSIVMAPPVLVPLDDAERVATVGGVSIPFPRGGLKVTALVHVDTSGAVTGVLTPDVTTRGDLAHQANVNAIVSDGSGGLLVLGDVQSTDRDGSTTVYVDGGPVDVGGALTLSTGTWLAHVDAAGTGTWAHAFGAHGANGFPAALGLDGDYVWGHAFGYGDFSWDSPVDRARAFAPASNAVLFRAKWR